MCVTVSATGEVGLGGLYVQVPATGKTGIQEAATGQTESSCWRDPAYGLYICLSICISICMYFHCWTCILPSQRGQQDEAIGVVSVGVGAL